MDTIKIGQYYQNYENTIRLHRMTLQTIYLFPDRQFHAGKLVRQFLGLKFYTNYQNYMVLRSMIFFKLISRTSNIKNRLYFQ